MTLAVEQPKADKQLYWLFEQELCYRIEGKAWTQSGLTGWSFRKRIDIQTAYLDANLADFPLYVPIVADADIGGECLANGFDIRFTAADGVTELPYERVSFSVTAGEATGEFWVKTNVATAGTYIWLYYGNASAPDGADPENVWDDDYAAVYHMKDGVDNAHIYDSTANNNDGTKKGANEPIEAAGKIGKGQDFDGGDDHVDCGISTSLKIQSELMVECWLNGAAPHNFAGILTRGNADVWEFGLYGPAWGNRYFQVTVGGTDYPREIPPFDYDVWGHVVVVFKDAANTIDWYFDGDFVSQQTGVTGVIPDSENHLRIGTRDGWYSYEGLLDEIRVSSFARSAAWIAYEYANMNAADGGLTWGAEEISAPACWHMDHLAEGEPSRVRQLLRSTHVITDYGTNKASLAACQAAASSFFYDSATGRLHVHTSAGDAPDTASKYYMASHFWKYFSTHQYESPNTLYDPAGLFIEPRLGKVPADLTQEVNDFSEVGVRESWGSIKIANGDGKYDAALVTYIWHMCPFLLKVGAPGDAYANLVTVHRGRTGSIGWTDDDIEVGMEDSLRAEDSN